MKIPDQTQSREEGGEFDVIGVPYPSPILLPSFPKPAQKKKGTKRREFICIRPLTVIKAVNEKMKTRLERFMSGVKYRYHHSPFNFTVLFESISDRDEISR